MTDDEKDDAFTVPDDAKSSRNVLAALRKAEDEFRDWQTTCDTIDNIYSRFGSAYDVLVEGASWRDSELDLFWASFEVLKPAVYARPPQPVVAPLFKDGRALADTTAELLERCAISSFKRTGIDDVMLHTRDDVLFAARGALWLRHETEGGEHKVCVEHKDRRDFLHEPGRKWCEVGWVAAGEWLTKRDMRKRFRPHSVDAYQDAKYTVRRDDNDTDRSATARKCKVWEVWHRADNKVYWVTDGVDVLLDEGEPHLDLEGFFPCPKPAYGTTVRRSLIPVPDWDRYAVHFAKISELTRRIYSLLDSVRMKGLIPGGGDVGDTLTKLMQDDRDDTLLIEVPAAALIGGAGQFVQWLPLTELATAIQGLIEARAQLIQDFYQLSGISDIMRGATEAEETLGAQQLKSQFGSVRVREKSEELQRVAADAVKIASEIIAEKFPQAQLLEMSQMDIPTKDDIKKRIKAIEASAKAELEDLGKKAEQAQGDPNAAQMFEQAQQQILQKYAPALEQAQQQVAIEDVMKLLRDDRARSFVFEIESSSTILTDELQEKQSRNEFLSQFTSASQGLMGLAGMGEAGAKLAGSLMRFVLAPHRAGRDVDAAIEAFIDQAPQMAAMAQGQQGESEELIAAQKQLAEAETLKGQAAMRKVEADATLKQAENERKMAELQAKYMAEAEKLRQQADANRVKADEALAKVDLLRAQTMKALAEAGVKIDNQALDEFKSLADIEFRANEQEMKAAGMVADEQARRTDQAMNADQRAFDNERADRGEARADRQQTFNERTADAGTSNRDRR